jgi:AraC-like DNA-binding protein
VKKDESVKLSGPLEAEALRILRNVPGLGVVPGPAVADHGADAVLEFSGSRIRVAVQVKTRANAATAWQLVHQAERDRGMPLLLIAGETTAEARKIMAEHNVAVIDRLGNAHIELPGLLVHMEGRAPRRQARPARLAGKAGVIAQALLLYPGRDWQVQELAQQAGLSVGLTHRVLARLAGEGLVAAEGAGPQRVRRVTDPAALLDLWAEENADRPSRTRAYLLARSPRQLITGLGTSLKGSGVGYALTGAVAASLIAPFTTAVPVAEVWVTATAGPEQLCDALGAEIVTEGNNIFFLQARDDTPLAFREQASGLWVANRFRVYCDLLRDPRRGREQADHLRRELIGF